MDQRYAAYFDVNVAGRRPPEQDAAEVQRVARAIAAADTVFVTLRPDAEQVRYERLASAAIEAVRDS